MFPLLKLCTGEVFEKDHWRDLFTILNIPKESKVETLKFGSLLDAEQPMLKKSNEIKELSARA